MKTLGYWNQMREGKEIPEIQETKNRRKNEK